VDDLVVVLVEDLVVAAAAAEEDRGVDVEVVVTGIPEVAIIVADGGVRIVLVSYYEMPFVLYVGHFLMYELPSWLV
jgi:hypothetical protein